MKRSSTRGDQPRQGSGAPALADGSRGRVPGRPFAEAIGPAGDAIEREADHVAEIVAGRGLRPGGGLGWTTSPEALGAGRPILTVEAEQRAVTIRRAPKHTAAPEALTVPDSPSRAAESEPASATDAGEFAPDAESQEGSARAEGMAALLVEDDSDAGRGQMRRSEFVAALRTATCAAVDDGLSGTGRDSAGCPWIDHWIGYYEGLSASHVERALLRYAPEARGVTAAADYIPLVAARVRRSAEAFADTGEIAGLPDDMPASAMPGGGVLAAFGGMFFKARPGGPRHADPISVRRQLGDGESLPGRVRAPMESAFGASFSRVRFHNDAAAARMSERLNARAFTVGQHVAFGSGEFRPGTVVGDALIAHELAHVVQQERAEQMRQSSRSAEAMSAPLERDADSTAVRAVVSIAMGANRGLAKVGENALPRLKSGLRLQRCGRHDPVPSPTPEIEATEEALGGHAVACMIRANQGPKSKTSGIWYAQGYKASFPKEWKDDYADGYANPDYWERISTNHWRLKKGRSASAAVKAWLKGLTISECFATAIVSEVDAVRAAVGDAKFDALYGSEDTAVTPRLEVGIKGSNVLQGGVLAQQSSGDIGTIGNRPASVGEWHYFYNHPQYLLKHPAGVYQGENAMLRPDKAANGDQLWEGLGQSKVTERQMYANMMADYNRPRDKWDEDRLDAIRKANGGVLPPEYDLTSGIFPVTLNSYQDILDAPPYKIRGTTRKGGYVPSARRALDPKKVEELRDKP